MRKLAALLIFGVAATLLVACGSSSARLGEGQNMTADSTGNTFTGGDGFRGPAAPAGIAAMPPSFATPAPASRALLSKEQAPPSDFGSAPSQLDIIQRQVISQASLSIEVTVVPAATSQVRAIAEGLGGFVEQLSSSGGAKQQQASITVRVPQPQFFAAMERLEALGKVQNRNVGSEDVSSQFIDLKARLASSLRQEQSMLSLLSRAATVTEILTIERELARVRGEIERMQGQLNFLERRVEMATIHVSLFPPQAEQVPSPSATLEVEVKDVAVAVEQVKALIPTLDGKLDRVYVSVKDDQERAELLMRVFSDKFDLTISALERQGEVTVKVLNQGLVPAGQEKARPEQPDSYVQIAFVEDDDSKAWLWWAIGGPIAGVVLVSLLVVLVYRAGRRRA
ncbi:MAG: DUF4349 domain-containing protein [Dehalococcoidia bacterium]|nr:DUF4349 domain-containing protein [Dehalococcoidia bacterium]MSQ16520.1 DUF4349 domain-containing protein [Dehalococcoidia bacterium]